MVEKTDTGASVKKEIAGGLSHVLADSCALDLKTHIFQWYVEGPRFRDLHLMFEEQYTELTGAVDLIAERIRALGQYAPGSFGQSSRLASIEGAKGVPKAEDMVKQLAAVHEIVEKTIRSALPAAQRAGDEVTAGLLVDRLAVHGKTA